MKELMQIFVPSMILVFFSEYNSKYKAGQHGEKQYIRKEKLFYIVMAISMAIYVGLRTWYNDTVTYMGSYQMLLKTNSIFEGIEWKLGSSPGFMLVNNILKQLDFSVQSFIMFYALITVGIYLWFIRKYTDNLWMSVFFFYTMGGYTFTMAAIKQCVAVAFCLVAVDRFIQKKRWTFILWVLLASTFHPYSLMYIIIPLLTFRPWTHKTFLMLGAFGVAGISLQRMLGVVVDITSMLGEEYDLNSFSGDGVNIFRLLVIWAPIVLSLLARKSISRSDNCENNLIMNLSMLNAEIMFIALFGTANYFARLANYFLIFQAISLPWLFRYFNEKSKKILIMGTVICYLLYFCYANIINQPFDAQFDKIGLLDYLKTLF